MAICTVLIRFRLADAASIPAARTAMSELVDSVRAHEPEMLTYVAYQEADQPLRFCSYMEFLDERGYEHHSTSAHLRRFVAAIAPLCSEEPDCTRLTELRRAEPA